MLEVLSVVLVCDITTFMESHCHGTFRALSALNTIFKGYFTLRTKRVTGELIVSRCNLNGLVLPTKNCLSEVFLGHGSKEMIRLLMRCVGMSCHLLGLVCQKLYM